MYHSITIGTKNTWDDWHLIPSSRPIFSEPPVKTKFIEIPGAHAQLNIATLINGHRVFGNRTGSIEFVVADGYLGWTQTYSDIVNYLQGKQMYAILEDEPAYVYEGIFTVNQWSSGKSFSSITLDYSLLPYKNLNDGGYYWLWDPFSFEYGIIGGYKNLVVDGVDSLTVSVIGNDRNSVPEIITSASGITVNVNSVTYSLAQGPNVIPAITLPEGETIFVFSGVGVVTIDFKGGSL